MTLPSSNQPDNGSAEASDHARVASTLEQGDVVWGLAGGFLAAGPVAAAARGVDSEVPLAPEDVFVEAVPSTSGWYIVTAQDCDIVKDSEPTIDVAPVEAVPEHKVAGLVGRYSSRQFLLPDHPDLTTPGHRHVVDLSYQVPVLRQAFDKPDLRVIRPLTQPNRRRFARWLGHRKGRAAFADEVVTAVLEPFSHVRAAAQSRFNKAAAPRQAPLEARLVGAVSDWYARTTTGRIEVFGEYDHVTLARAGLLEAGQAPNAAVIHAALTKLRASSATRMATTAPDAGYELTITVGFLDDITASEFRTYALLVD